MINNTIARRYAKALVQIGAGEALLDRFSEELSAVGSVFGGNAGLRAAFADPALTLQQKKAIMMELIAKMGLSQMIGNFLLLLVDKNRVAFLGQIVQTYETLADEQSGIIRPLVSTAFPLDDSQVASIREALEKKTGRKIVPRVTVDPGLLGGLVTQIGDIAYDNSVRTQLERIQDILQKG